MVSLTDDEWFCSKITVTTPEGAHKLFPCHRWMSRDKKLVLRNSVVYFFINQKGNIFLCDYERLKDLDGNELKKKKQYLAAPLCLLFSNQGKLIPIAIQLNQEPGAGNPIFLPSDSEHDWLVAKTFVRNAEFNEHELNFHLLQTHLLGEVFTVAMMRTLPSCHPLFKLLVPHTRYNLQINIMARNLLVSANGYFVKFTAIGNDSMTTFLKRAASSLTYSSLCLPDNIKERGMEDIPSYYYRDDGLKMWDIIYKYGTKKLLWARFTNVLHFALYSLEFVSGLVSHYYSDQDVQEDKELHAWLTEIREKGGLDNRQAGFPESFCTVGQLAKFVTMVIFTVSGQHAAVNNGQFDFGGYMPNFPSSLRCPPPRQKGSTTKDSILETLPDVKTTVNTMAIVYLLSEDSSDRYPLGHYPEELFSEETPQKLMTQFKIALQDLERSIEGRNKTLDLPYTYLNPRTVDNSIAI
ncbi:hypothetical protein NFI96_016576 [Prochilodus magdalenae]|nr:hypothetical protein NFI96_016576 [Prochilodus magdalenae]